ncbi:hypothetical protein CHH28_13415 [Bacterioplanes sanyensis]|uniref:DUF4381 domain-containing protein n=1 Tax=Bacterioplanes sanyensis TaxID=1249553 RepID=A0A222FKR5_9GAMM|nr:DUF4381 domain-containing protein [Bacterioplanes sanyensis]ASP39608.1 hypothetical protein CHH28_13415 [Bacterioplanes sanyensis]
MSTAAFDPSQLNLEPLITPDPVSAWPAYGWWLVAALALLAIALAVFFWWHRRQQQRAARLAQRQLQQGLPSAPQAACMQCNQILKQACRYYFPQALSWHGDQWRTFLTDTGMSPHSSEALAHATYDPQRADQVDTQQLQHDCLRWLQQCWKGGHHA